MKIELREVDIEDCMPYESGYGGKKAEWRRTQSSMYPKVKASLKKDGMINPLWVFELPGGKFRIVKGACRAVAAFDLVREGLEKFKKVKVLVAPIGMERRDANRQWRSSGYVEDVPMVDDKGNVIVEEGKTRMFPRGF